MRNPLRHVGKGKKKEKKKKKLEEKEEKQVGTILLKQNGKKASKATSGI